MRSLPSPRTTEAVELAEPTVFVEEYATDGLVRASGRSDLWLGLAIVLIALVGLGVAGHITGPPDGDATPVGIVAPPSPSAGSALTRPGIVVPSATPATSSPAREELASVLEVSSATADASTAIRLQRAQASERTSGDVTLVIDGHAPSDTASVTIDVRSVAGQLLASAQIPTVGDERPGENGEPRIGLRTLVWRLVVPGPSPAEGWQVEVTWRDRTGDSMGSVSEWIAT
jgi:hypothetical protein